MPALEYAPRRPIKLLQSGRPDWGKQIPVRFVQAAVERPERLQNNNNPVGDNVPIEKIHEQPAEDREASVIPENPEPEPVHGS